MGNNLGERCRKFFVIVLVVLFGSASWLAINGLWVELPAMVALGIPEGYNLASYLVIIIQLANVGPIAFTITNHFLRGNKLEVPTIYLMLFAGVVSCLLLVFFWDKTTYWPALGDYRSTALLCLSFVLALVNCTSNVTFIPFMVRLKSSYMIWYFVGQGFSSLAPSLVALGQGVGKPTCVANFTYIDQVLGENCTEWMSETKPAKFPPHTFYAFLFASMLLSFIGFIFLDKHSSVKKEYAIREAKLATPTPSSIRTKVRSKEDVSSKDDDMVYENLNGEGSKRRTHLSNAEYVFLFILLGIVNALNNSILPSIQTYSCGAYGFDGFLLAASLGKVANPLACFIVLFYPQKSLKLLGGTCLLGVIMGGYCMATALLSPVPPLQDQPAGIALLVISWVMVNGLFAHVKATIGWILRHEPDNHKLLTWYGVVTQLGSMIGAFIMFPLVNVLSIFVPYHSDPCDGYPTCEYLNV